MTTEQSKAVQLANKLESLTHFSLRRDLEPTLQAAAELRRLHAANLLLHERHAGDNQILQSIETQRNELLEALMRIDSMCEKPLRYSSIAVQEFARAAIAKATGE